MDASAYRQRRARLMEHMRARGGGIALLPTASEVARNADVFFPFRYDSNFFYLTGFPEPEALVVLIAGALEEVILFCRSKHAEREIWDGFRFGPDAAAERFGFDRALPIEDLDSELPKLIANQPALFYGLGANPEFDGRVQHWLADVRQQARNGTTAPATVFDVRTLLSEMRLIKDADELATMKKAAEISANAHIAAMRTTRPGRREYEVEAELLASFRRQGSQSPAYGSIVAGGANACVLHYVQNDQELRDGDLVLIDAGCELDGYASDITRTFPVGGRFSAAQRELYELVLSAQLAAIEATRPGRAWNDPHDAATRVLAQGMLDLGLVQGSLSSVLESGSYRRFFMHRTGHWLGMDVHDVGDYREPDAAAPAGAERPWRVLAPGMVLTIEPGIYVRAGEGIPERYWNQGIRIEDDAVVTPGGCEILSAKAPKTVADVEAAMRS
ncbi:MAG: aminopeptidase P N-terminal domain-containing protein [Burkholderiaceae bacterium]|jgi:Xaa-Pro aminopeptidase